MKALYILIFTLMIACGKEVTKEVSVEAPSQGAEVRKEKPEQEEPMAEEEKEEIIPLQVNEWIDPITELRWSLGGSVPHEKKDCGKKYRLPTEEEAKQAIYDGILDISKTMGRDYTFWIDAKTPTKYTLQGMPEGPEPRYEAGLSGLFCIRK